MILSGGWRKRAFNAFKATVYTLLVINIFLYLRHGTLTEALDSLGWVLLLAVFEWESRSLDEHYMGWWERAAVWTLQIVGYGLAIHACIDYFRTGEWVDFANALIWLLVCATLVYDIFVPGEFGDREWHIRNWIKRALYASLVAIAVYWGVTSDWLDFYDAMLWILCFFAIELNVFAYEEKVEAAHHAAPASRAIS